jgi:hypothetical protein
MRFGLCGGLISGFSQAVMALTTMKSDNVMQLKKKHD